MDAIFTVINDYQPLKSIISKCTVICSPHIYKLFLCLQKHEFDLKCSTAKIMLDLDAPNRAYNKNSNPEFDQNSLTYHVQSENGNCFIHNVQFGNEKCFIHYMQFGNKNCFIHCVQFCNEQCKQEA